MRTLNVKRTTLKEVESIWKMKIPHFGKSEYFIRCNAKGEVNWEVAPLYDLQELEKRGNYQIIQ